MDFNVRSTARGHFTLRTNKHNYFKSHTEEGKTKVIQSNKKMKKMKNEKWKKKWKRKKDEQKEAEKKDWLIVPATSLNIIILFFFFFYNCWENFVSLMNAAPPLLKTSNKQTTTKPHFTCDWITDFWPEMTFVVDWASNIYSKKRYPFCIRIGSNVLLFHEGWMKKQDSNIFNGLCIHIRLESVPWRQAVNNYTMFPYFSNWKKVEEIK